VNRLSAAIRKLLPVTQVPEPGETVELESALWPTLGPAGDYVSVEQPDVVDVISTDKESGHVVLTISDHLDWSNSEEHQTILQAKLNKYLAFVETGELLTRYSDAKGRPVAFSVVFKYRPDRGGCNFLARARAVIESAGFTLRHEIFAESYDN
jgi:hypothetical protein